MHIICKKIIKPILRKRYWFIFFFIIVQSCYVSAVKQNDKTELPQLDVLLGVKFYNKNKEYSTFSFAAGEIEFEEKEKKLSFLTTYSAKNTKIALLTYPEFIKNIKPAIDEFVYFEKLTSAIEKYLEVLEVTDVKIAFKVIIIPKLYRIDYESKRGILKNDEVKLVFMTSISEDALTKPSQKYESQLLNYFPHELFHYLVVSSNFSIKKSLRNETYASLFGSCVSYTVIPKFNDNIVLGFPDYFFKDIQKDLNRIRKTIKKDKLSNSARGNIIARYYFQAAANNRTGNNISSDNIPKFCHKLFSEHNFKHPIEKKPPPWFKGFLEENKKDDD